MQINLTIIGFGNLAKAMIQPWLKDEDINLNISSPNILNHCPNGVDIANCSPDNTKVVQSADLILLAVKPYQISSILKEISQYLSEETCIISVAAGITCQQINNCLANAQPVVRAMPNTTAEFSLCPTPLFSATPLSNTLQMKLNHIFNLLGPAFWINDESQMDLLTALVGSGPAFVYEFIIQLSQASQKIGLPKEVANQLAANVCLAASQIASQNPQQLPEIQSEIVSPNGTTAAGIAELEAHKFNLAVQSALKSAYDRSKGLTRENE